ncbi:hypothetical protein TRIP_B40340 [uncultured Desulfatiglans sp.]|uniref:Uncharacterized protein n=1 Tax=Uncultured Desulfatiglans sp. TaxID=1748965 RepID=A0A653AEP1_UNCDX|nr:hypothetical protein TRIP_B40340 [uncultured Desulfatiglans sp.]
MAPAELDVIEETCGYVREEGGLEREVSEGARAPNVKLACRGLAAKQHRSVSNAMFGA